MLPAFGQVIEAELGISKADLDAEVNRPSNARMQKELLYATRGLQERLDRTLAEAGEDKYADDSSVGIDDVIRAHFAIADFFYSLGEGIADAGPRDFDLLHSALYRQHISFGGELKWGLPLQRCSCLLFGIVKNHPFHDANKRTAFLVSLLHLRKIGLTPTLSHKKYEDFIVRVADREVHGTEDDEAVSDIYNFLKRATRPLDQKFYQITYRELEKIVSGYGFYFDDPFNNYVTIRRLDGTYAAKIGYPGPTRVIGQKTLGHIREHLGLLPRQGVDSGEFFGNADPLDRLIAHYRAPLVSLSKR